MTLAEIKFNPNVPVDVRLDRGPEGKEGTSKFTNPDGTPQARYYYTCNGNTAFMYLSQSARNQLVRTHAQAGDVVRICKTTAGQNTAWNVEVLSDSAEPQKGGAGVGSAPNWDELKTYQATYPEEAPARSLRILAPAPPAPSYSNGNGNGNGYSNGNGHTNGNGSAPPPVRERPSSLNTMSRAMSAAVDIILSAKEYARKAGLALDEATVEDVRTIAITLYIDARKEY